MGPIIFFFFATFKADSEANWTIAAYPTFLALALYNTQKSWWIKPTLTIWSVLFTVVFTEVFFHWLPIDPSYNKTTELHRFDPIIKTQRKNTEIKPLFASSFQMAAKISFQTKTQVYKLRGLNRKDFYDFRSESIPTGKYFFLAAEKNTPVPEWVNKEGYRLTRTYGTDSIFIIQRFERL